MDPLSQVDGTAQVVIVKETNSIGLAGFIVSLVGFVSCGLLSPIGFILSLFGLTRSPKGFAIAGTIIGGLGSLFFVFVGLAIILALLGMGAIAERVAVDAQLSIASQLIEDRWAETGALPNDQDGQVVIDRLSDPWGSTLRYTATGADVYIIASAGEDLAFDTEDDLTTADMMFEPGTFDDVEWDTDDEAVEGDGGG